MELHVHSNGNSAELSLSTDDALSLQQMLAGAVRTSIKMRDGCFTVPLILVVDGMPRAGQIDVSVADVEP